MIIEQKIELLKDTDSELVKDLCIQSIGLKRSKTDNKHFYRTLKLFIDRHKDFQGAMFLTLDVVENITDEVRDSTKTYIALLNYLLYK